MNLDSLDGPSAEEAPLRSSQSQSAAVAGGEAGGLFAWYEPGFSDGLGDRLRLFDNTEGPPLELLRIRQELSEVPHFEFSLRERAFELAHFAHRSHARVCRIDRLPEPGGGLAVVSERTEGQRLTDVLRAAERRGLQPSCDVALALSMDLLAAVASFHARGRHLAHGAIGPDRLVIVPGGRVMVTEYVFGSALKRLGSDDRRLWSEYGLALPPGAADKAFDQSTDVLQAGLVILALTLGRRLARGDYPSGLAARLAEAEERCASPSWKSSWAPLREFLERSLCISGAPYADAVEARDAFARLAAADPRRSLRPAYWPALLAASEDGDWEMAPPANRFGPPSLPVPLRSGSSQPAAASSPGVDPIEALAGDDDDGTDPVEVEPAGGERPPPGVQAGGRGERWPPGMVATGGDEPPQELAPAVEERWQAGRDAAGMTLADGGPGAGSEAFGPKLPRRRLWPLVALLAVALVAAAEGIFIAWGLVNQDGASPITTGRLEIASEPGNAAVTIDGRAAGFTPLALDVTPGRHAIVLSAGEEKRTLDVEIREGETVWQFVEMPSERAAAGRLRISTEPAGAEVHVDGALSGSTPLVVPNLSPGVHEVVLVRAGRSVRHTIEVEAGATMALLVPMPAVGAPAAGWASIASPVELQVYERGELVGVSRSGRIMLPAGPHEVELVNEGLGFREPREIVVPAGGTLNVDVVLPAAEIDINATPWAEVWIDGRRIGETPLGGVSVEIGPHEATFRHPEFGERTISFVVSLDRPTRLSADMRR